MSFVPSASEPTDNKEKRLIRLLGEAKSEGFDNAGGGFPLPALFQPILDYISDNGVLYEVKKLIEPVKQRTPNHTRILYVFGTWDALITDLVETLLDAEIIEYRTSHQGRYLCTGAAWTLGLPMEIIPGKLSLTVFAKRIRSRQEEQDRINIAIGEWLYAMKLDTPHEVIQRGVTVAVGFHHIDTKERLETYLHEGKYASFRPIRKRNLSTLKLSFERNGGWNPEYPPVLHETGHVLDGAHRFILARELGITPPQAIILKGLSGSEMIAHAWALNLGTWPSSQDQAHVRDRMRRLNIPVRMDKPILPKAPAVISVLLPSFKRGKQTEEYKHNKRIMTNIRNYLPTVSHHSNEGIVEQVREKFKEYDFDMAVLQDIQVQGGPLNLIKSLFDEYNRLLQEGKDWDRCIQIIMRMGKLLRYVTLPNNFMHNRWELAPSRSLYTFRNDPLMIEAIRQHQFVGMLTIWRNFRRKKLDERS